jgi:hypothetical protein
MIEEIIEVLQNDKEELSIQSLPGKELGLCTNFGIVIDVSKHIACTVIHECFHRIYPEWDQEKTEAEMLKLLEKLTPGEIGEIAGAFLRRATFG